MTCPHTLTVPAPAIFRTLWTCACGKAIGYQRQHGTSVAYTRRVVAFKPGTVGGIAGTAGD